MTATGQRQGAQAWQGDRAQLRPEPAIEEALSILRRRGLEGKIIPFRGGQQLGNCAALGGRGDVILGHVRYDSHRQVLCVRI